MKLPSSMLLGLFLLSCSVLALRGGPRAVRPHRAKVTECGDRYKCPGERKCLDSKQLCDGIQDCALTKADEEEFICTLNNVPDTRKSFSSSVGLSPDLARSNNSIETLLSILCRVPSGRQAVLVTDDEIVLLQWAKIAENPLRGQVNVSKVHERRFPITFNYTGRLFVVQNYNHQYAFVMDSVGVVHAFHNNRPNIFVALSLFVGKKIAPGVRIGSMALDWNEDILVFFDEATHCIQSVKLTNLGNVYKITCLAAACPAVSNLMIDVVDQNVFFNVHHQIEVTTLLGFNSMPVRCTSPKVAANGSAAANIYLDYHYKQRAVYLLDAEAGTLRNVSVQSLYTKTATAPMITIHSSAAAIGGAKFYSHTGTQSFWFEPRNRTAYLFRTLEMKLMSMSLAKFVPANKTVQLVVFKDQEIKNPKIKHRCPMQCQYMCHNQGVANGTCDCPRGYEVMPMGECWKTTKAVAIGTACDDEQEKEVHVHLTFGGKVFSIEAYHFYAAVVSATFLVLLILVCLCCAVCNCYKSGKRASSRSSSQATDNGGEQVPRSTGGDQVAGEDGGADKDKHGDVVVVMVMDKEGEEDQSNQEDKENKDDQGDKDNKDNEDAQDNNKGDHSNQEVKDNEDAKENKDNEGVKGNKDNDEAKDNNDDQKVNNNNNNNNNEGGKDNKNDQSNHEVKDNKDDPEPKDNQINVVVNGTEEVNDTQDKNTEEVKSDPKENVPEEVSGYHDYEEITVFAQNEAPKEEASIQPPTSSTPPPASIPATPVTPKSPEVIYAVPKRRNHRPVNMALPPALGPINFPRPAGPQVSKPIRI